MADSLARILSLALRHNPALFGTEVDANGWTSIPALVSGIIVQFPALSVTEERVREHVAEQLIERFEIQEDRIRALYGHSLQHVTVGEIATPPALLFHATKAILLPRIRTDGLIAKGRNGVHLTARWNYALSVRDTHTQKGQRGVILAVETEATKFKGIVFYQATPHVWLSPYVPARFLSMVPVEHRASPTSPPGTLIPFDNPNNHDILRIRIAALSDDDCC